MLSVGYADCIGDAKYIITLHASCGAVYWNWSCLWGFCWFVYWWVCYHDNSKLCASILTRLGLLVKVVTVSSWLNFGRPTPPGRGLRRGEIFWLHLTTASTQCWSRLLALFFHLPCILLWFQSSTYYLRHSKQKCNVSKEIHLVGKHFRLKIIVMWFLMKVSGRDRNINEKNNNWLLWWIFSLKQCNVLLLLLIIKHMTRSVLQYSLTTVSVQCLRLSERFSHFVC